MRSRADLTPKGARTAQRILDAAIRCVARDGVAASSMQRIADEAGVGKRAVVYYYGTREGMLDHVVRHVADRMLDQLEEAVSDLNEPGEIVERGFEILWATVTTDRALLAAWFGLQAESMTNPALRSSAGYISDQLERIVGDLVDAQIARGRVLSLPRPALLALVASVFQGFVSYFLEHGNTDALAGATAAFQHYLSGSVAHPDARLRAPAGPSRRRHR